MRTFIVCTAAFVLCVILLSFRSSGVVSQQGTTRWEYALVAVNSADHPAVYLPNGTEVVGASWAELIGKCSHRPESADVFSQDMVNALGNDGWEMASITDGAKGHEWWFKRIVH